MSGFQYDRSSLDVGPGDAREEFYGLTGIRLSNFFGGSSLTDAFGGAVLAPVGAPSFDALVADTLNGAPLITDPPSYLWNHAFRFQATGDSYTVPAVDSVPLGEESVMVGIKKRVVTFLSETTFCNDINGVTYSGSVKIDSLALGTGESLLLDISSPLVADSFYHGASQ